MKQGFRIWLLIAVVSQTITLLQEAQSASKFISAIAYEVARSHTPFGGVASSVDSMIACSPSGSCTPLFVPSFGQLLLESTDITQSQNAVNISEGDAVIVQCAEGYHLVHVNTNTLLGTSFVIRCGGTGAWSVNVTELVCVKQSGKPARYTHLE